MCRGDPLRISLLKISPYSHQVNLERMHHRAHHFVAFGRFFFDIPMPHGFSPTPRNPTKQEEEKQKLTYGKISGINGGI